VKLATDLKVNTVYFASKSNNDPIKYFESRNPARYVMSYESLSRCLKQFYWFVGFLVADA